MRCTRCDGLAVPQAVGIARDGRVVFGWCLECLADTGCKLVEVPASGPADLRLTFRPDDPPARVPLVPTQVDQSAWVVATVAFLMIGWGLALLAAGLFLAPRSTTGRNPLGNGTGPFLGVGGAATALLGLVLLVLATARQRYPGMALLRLLGGFAFLAAVAILGYGVYDYEPRRNVPLVLATALALLISGVAHGLDRSQRRKGLAARASAPRKPAAAGAAWSNARGPKNLN